MHERSWPGCKSDSSVQPVNAFNWKGYDYIKSTHSKRVGRIKMSLRYQRKILGTKDERMKDGGGFNHNKPVVQQSKVTKVAKQPIPVKGRTNISAEDLSKAV